MGNIQRVVSVKSCNRFLLTCTRLVQHVSSNDGTLILAVSNARLAKAHCLLQRVSRRSCHLNWLLLQLQWHRRLMLKQLLLQQHCHDSCGSHGSSETKVFCQRSCQEAWCHLQPMHAAAVMSTDAQTHMPSSRRCFQCLALCARQPRHVEGAYLLRLRRQPDKTAAPLSGSIRRWPSSCGKQLATSGGLELRASWAGEVKAVWRKAAALPVGEAWQ